MHRKHYGFWLLLLVLSYQSNAQSRVMFAHSFSLLSDINISPLLANHSGGGTLEPSNKFFYNLFSAGMSIRSNIFSFNDNSAISLSIEPGVSYHLRWGLDQGGFTSHTPILLSYDIGAISTPYSLEQKGYSFAMGIEYIKHLYLYDQLLFTQEYAASDLKSIIVPTIRGAYRNYTSTGYFPGFEMFFQFGMRPSPARDIDLGDVDVFDDVVVMIRSKFGFVYYWNY